MGQRRGFKTFDEAAKAGPYDEYPMFPPGTDPQLCLSRNERPQPFYLVCSKDSVLVQMSGEGRVEFKDSPLLRCALEPGDFVYVPAGTPHRIVPASECVQYRFKAEHAGLEGVAWYCEACGTELRRDEWDTAELLPQEAYLRHCEAFNADRARRTCAKCGAVHPPVDISGNRWAKIAAELRDLARRRAAGERIAEEHEGG
jgi:3-hydroxyanthranilate 3,4-dioxygenase